MSEQWWAIYEKTSGRLVSIGSTDTDASAEANARRVVPDVTLAKKGFAKKPLAGTPATGEMWDEQTRAFAPRPVKDYVKMFFDDPQVAALPPEARAMLEDRIGRYFGLGRVL